MKVLIIIPARFKSKRLPGKPLKKILGKELILRVLEKCEKAISRKSIFVATDSSKILNFVKKKNFKCIMTSSKNITGTDRVAEVSKKIKADIYINVQGDEPLVSPNSILKIIKSKKKNRDFVICGYSKISKKENPKNVNIPKVVFNNKKELIYISRNVVPGSKIKKKTNFFKQICIYAFNKKELSIFKKYNKKSELEKIEDIEILRFFELNKKIKMVELPSTSLAVDVPNDIKKIEKVLKK